MANITQALYYTPRHCMNQNKTWNGIKYRQKTTQQKLLVNSDKARNNKNRHKQKHLPRFDGFTLKFVAIKIFRCIQDMFFLFQQ